MNKFLVGGLIAAVAAPLLAQVAPVPPVPPVPRVAPVPPRPPMPPMAMRTFNRSEVQAKIAKVFARVDTNRDGFVTEQEMTTLRGRMDGMAKVREFGDGGDDANAAFDRMDANHDGTISRDEFAKGRQVRIERIVMRGGPEGAGPDGAPGHAMKMRMEGHHTGMMMGAGMLKMADANRDGRVSLQEATTLALQHFDMADANHDGQLTPNEMQAGHMKMREIRIKQRAG